MREVANRPGLQFWRNQRCDPIVGDEAAGLLRESAVVLWGRFATDIPRAGLLIINNIRLSKMPIWEVQQTSNQVVRT
jgi:hypothetical protein